MGLFGSSKSSKQSSSSSYQPPPPSRHAPTQTSARAGSRVASRSGGTPRPLSDLRPNTIYLLLFARYTGELNDFHWGLYLHENPDVGGTKFHVTNMRFDGNWKTDHGVTTGATRSMALIGLMRLANVKPADKQVVKSIIQEDDTKLNSVPGMTCRIWVMRACGRLRQGGYMMYPSWEVLQQEALDFGNTNLDGTDKAIQPRPLVDSKVCKV